MVELFCLDTAVSGHPLAGCPPQRLLQIVPTGISRNLSSVSLPAVISGKPSKFALKPVAIRPQRLDGCLAFVLQHARHMDVGRRYEGAKS